MSKNSLSLSGIAPRTRGHVRTRSSSPENRALLDTDSVNGRGGLNQSKNHDFHPTSNFYANKRMSTGVNNGANTAHHGAFPSFDRRRKTRRSMEPAKVLKNEATTVSNFAAMSMRSPNRSKGRGLSSVVTSTVQTSQDQSTGAQRILSNSGDETDSIGVGASSATEAQDDGFVTPPQSPEMDDRSPMKKRRSLPPTPEKTPHRRSSVGTYRRSLGIAAALEGTDVVVPPMVQGDEWIDGGDFAMKLDEVGDVEQDKQMEIGDLNIPLLSSNLDAIETAAEARSMPVVSITGPTGRPGNKQRLTLAGLGRPMRVPKDDADSLAESGDIPDSDEIQGPPILPRVHGPMGAGVLHFDSSHDTSDGPYSTPVRESGSNRLPIKYPHSAVPQGRSGRASARERMSDGAWLLHKLIPAYRKPVANPFSPEARRRDGSVDPQRFELGQVESLVNPETEDLLEDLGAVRISRYNSDFEEIKEIGSGSFGTVYKCRHRIDGWLYAVKRSKKPIRGTASTRVVLKEVYALAALNSCPHIVRYYNAFTDKDGHLYIQTELCEEGTLASHRETGTRYSETELLKIMGQIATGLDYIHSHRLVHMDIKPENIFVVDGVYKIGDLGLTLPDNVESVSEGDSRYLSREVLQEDTSHLPKGDVFALGASIYELAIGRVLPDRGREWNSIRDGILSDELVKNYSPEFVSLLKSMMHPWPSLRPSCSEILRRLSVDTVNNTSKIDALEAENESLRNRLTQLAMSIQQK